MTLFLRDSMVFVLLAVLGTAIAGIGLVSGIGILEMIGGFVFLAAFIAETGLVFGSVYSYVLLRIFARNISLSYREDKR